MSIPTIRKAFRHCAATVIITLGAAMCAGPSMAAGATATSRILLGGDGGWDYLAFDPTHRRLFITRGSHVQIVDTDSLTVKADIAHTDGVHGVALATDRQLGFTSNGQSNSVTVFDLETLSTIDEIHGTGDGPDAILVDPGNAHVLTFNGRSHDASVIDIASRKVIATIPLPGKPEFAVLDGRGSIFVNIEDKGSIARIDAAAGKLTAEWPLPGCDSPTGLAIDAARHRLFSVCDNRVMVVTDSDSGQPIAKLPIGSGPDAVVYDPARALLLASNGEGTMSIAHQRDANHYEALASVPTQRGARTMAFDSQTQRAFLVTADFVPVAAGASAPSGRPKPVPGSFTLLVIQVAGRR